MIKHEGKNKFKMFLAFLVLGFFVTSSLGCETLRKKFTRQKKKGEEASQIIPVLDPIDYPPAVHTTDELFRHYHSLWRVWYKDFMIALDESAEDKRQKYLLAQLIGQVEEMKKLVIEEKQLGLNKLSDSLNQVQNEYEKPSVMRSRFSIKRVLESADKKMVTEFNPKVLQNYYVKQ